MRDKTHLYLLTMFIVFIISCEYFDSRLRIINMTKNPIVVETFSDSINMKVNNHTEYYLSNIIVEGGIINLTESGINGWPFFVRRSKNKRLNICIFNADTLKKYQSINLLINSKMYKKYSFTEEELLKMGWVVTVSQ